VPKETASDANLLIPVMRQYFAAVTLHSIPGITLICFQSSSGIDCNFTALKSRTVAHKTLTKFLLKFVQDISTKMTLSFLCASLSVRDLSTNSSADSGN
jgi:hypothetical protein